MRVILKVFETYIKSAFNGTLTGFDRLTASLSLLP